MKLRLITMSFLFFCMLHAYADEGMWMLGSLKNNKRTARTMKELGLRMPVKKLYNRQAVADGRSGQLRRLLLRSGSVRRRACVHQSPLRLQQHTTTLFGGA